MRTAPGARAALCLAALLSIGASFGLHPEPADSQAFASAGAGLHAARSEPAPHGCIACLSHGAAVVSPLLSILLDAAPSRPTSVLADPSPASRLAVRQTTGRSPPVRS